MPAAYPEFEYGSISYDDIHLTRNTSLMYIFCSGNLPDIVLIEEKLN